MINRGQLEAPSYFWARTSLLSSIRAVQHHSSPSNETEDIPAPFEFC